MRNGDQETENLCQISRALPCKVNQGQLLDYKSRSPGISTLLQEKVRYGLEPDNPRLLQEVFGLVEETTDGYAKKSIKILNWSIFELLLESIKDKSVPSNWRMMCLDNAYRPLRNLYKMAETNRDHTAINLSWYNLSRIDFQI